MRAIFALVAVLALCHLSTAYAANWAVLVAGSSTYDNYRHQADVAHAYQVVRKNGVPDSNIITFVYNDIANDPSNPFPGQVFNTPTAAGVPGVNVWQKLQITYQNTQVTPEIFLAVITGNSAALPAGSKVLNSTAHDDVFIFFCDHGAAGLIAFPSEYLYSNDLMNALTTMNKQHMYKRLVFYIEACESGSMFDGILPTNVEIYATTASNPSESSWGTYCPPDDFVNGQELNTCLGDLYSVNWIQNAEQSGPKETLEQQFVIVQNLTSQSHVMQYGDQTWTSEAIGSFIGTNPAHGAKKQVAKATAVTNPKQSSTVSTRDIPMHLAYYRYLRSTPRTAESKSALAKLRAELDAREVADDRFERLAALLVVDRHTGKQLRQAETLFAAPSKPVHSTACIKAAVEALRANNCDYDDYSLKYHRVIVNACQMHHNQVAAGQFIAKAIAKVCAA